MHKRDECMQPSCADLDFVQSCCIDMVLEIMEEIIKNILQIDKEAIEKQERAKQVLEEKENQKKALLKKAIVVAKIVVRKVSSK